MKRKHFYSVQEYAKERHYSYRYVRRLCAEGKISAFKEGRNWVILADQTKKAKVTWEYTQSGIRIPIPPIPPDGLFWDMSKRRFVSIEKYAKENGYRLVRRNGKKLIDFTSHPRYREDLAKLTSDLLERGRWATLDSGERVLVLN